MHSFEIYLPIAEIPVNVITILCLGVLSGLMSGLFGIGGGFLLTPLLIFMGIPPAVAVATTSNQIIASSVSGFLSHLRRKNVDLKMGFYLIIGGFIGSLAGVWLFSILKKMGQIDLVISISYFIFLTTIGSLMAIESFKHISAKRKGIVPGRPKLPHWLHNDKMPFIIHFPRSERSVSILLPLTIGSFAGILVSLMGIGGGFLMIPAMIYLIGMPPSVVIGTSLFQIIFTTAGVTFLQAVNTHTVDLVLAALLIAGSVVGVQFGTRAALKLPAERMRLLLAIIVLAVALKLGADLIVSPKDPYSVIEQDTRYENR